MSDIYLSDIGCSTLLASPCVRPRVEPEIVRLLISYSPPSGREILPFQERLDSRPASSEVKASPYSKPTGTENPFPRKRGLLPVIAPKKKQGRRKEGHQNDSRTIRGGIDRRKVAQVRRGFRAG